MHRRPLRKRHMRRQRKHKLPLAQSQLRVSPSQTPRHIHALPHLEAPRIHIRPHRFHGPSPVSPRRIRQSRFPRISPGPHISVHRVHPRRANPHHHLRATRLRIRHLFQPHHLRPAKLLNPNRFHRFSCRRSSRKISITSNLHQRRRHPPRQNRINIIQSQHPHSRIRLQSSAP